MKGSFGTLILIAMFALAFASCDLFTTRAPNPPDTGSTFIWTPATSLNTLLANFQGAMQVLDATNYARVFISSTDSISSGGQKTYEFIPARVDKSLFANWTVESERNYITKLRSALTQSKKVTLQFIGQPQFYQPNSSSGTITTQYSLILPLDGSSVLPASVSGTMIFQTAFVTTDQGGKEWRIISWTDLAPQIGSGSTWTDLKLKLTS
jgi:hypothetical protein